MEKYDVINYININGFNKAIANNFLNKFCSFAQNNKKGYVYRTNDNSFFFIYFVNNTPFVEDINVETDVLHNKNKFNNKFSELSYNFNIPFSLARLLKGNEMCIKGYCEIRKFVLKHPCLVRCNLDNYSEFINSDSLSKKKQTELRLKFIKKIINILIFQDFYKKYKNKEFNSKNQIIIENKLDNLKYNLNFAFEADNLKQLMIQLETVQHKYHNLFFLYFFAKHEFNKKDRIFFQKHFIYLCYLIDSEIKNKGINIDILYKKIEHKSFPFFTEKMAFENFQKIVVENLIDLC